MKTMHIFFGLILAFSSVSYSATYLKGGALIEDPTTVVSAAGTTTLTKASNSFYLITGTTTQTIVLPSALTIPNGRYFEIYNSSTGSVTVQSNGGATVKVIGAGENSKIVLTVNSTAAGTWAAQNAVAPATNGSITSSTSGPDRFERATIFCGTTSSITSQSGNWLASVNNISGSRCAFTMTSGKFSAPPICWGSIATNTTVATYSINIAITSTTTGSAGLIYQVGSAQGLGANDEFNIFCTGAR